MQQMLSIQQSIRNENNSKVKAVLLWLLMVCFILSTCSLRKGIQSFFSPVAPVELGTPKSAKNTFSKDKVVSLSSLSCSARVNSTDGDYLFKVPEIQKSMTGLWFFFILPAFLCAVFLFKRNAAFSFDTMPDLSGTSVPLFIKNRLLRI